MSIEIPRQVKKNSTPLRDRLVKDWEISAALGAAPPVVDLYIRLKLMTGLHRGDLLRLRLPYIHEDGIYVQPHKTAKTTGKRLIIEWDEDGELQAVISDIQRLPPRRIGDAGSAGDGAPRGARRDRGRPCRRALLRRE